MGSFNSSDGNKGSGIMATFLDATFRSDVSKLDKMLTKFDNGGLDDSVKHMAEGVVDYIRDNWSPVSPSTPLEPPAVVTGELDAMMKIEQSRDLLGRYASAFKIKFETEYAAALEYGYDPNHLAPRPFIRPAIAAVAKDFADYLKPAFEFYL